MPGNSTTLRTGMMISASEGIGTESGFEPAEAAADVSLSDDMAFLTQTSSSAVRRIHSRHGG